MFLTGPSSRLTRRSRRPTAANGIGWYLAFLGCPFAHFYASLSGLPKLADANNAGTKQASHCTLILTEGDSAKSLAVAGLGVVGRDNFGVFPLRGKLLNVREAKHDQIMKNEEIQNIKKIMGLQHNKEYTSTTSLRYGRLMIMTDQVFP
jgi:DNA topoisomerase II